MFDKYKTSVPDISVTLTDLKGSNEGIPSLNIIEGSDYLMNSDDDDNSIILKPPITP